MRSRITLPLVSFLLITSAVACTSKEPPKVAEVSTQRAPRQSRASGPSISAEIGALPEAAVQTAFKAVMPAVSECLREGRRSIYFLAGMLQAEIRVAQDGRARWVHAKRSTFGHRATEKCILDALGAQQWPRPVGGQNGIATQHFEIDTSERPPVSWSPDQIGKEGAKLEQAIDECRKQAGSAALSLTMYIDVDGKPMAAGGASSEAQGREGIDCAVEAAMKHVYNSPGSYPAKVSLQRP
jgi:hypothetical protein